MSETVIEETPENFAKMRNTELSRVEEGLYLELEKTFGKYLYVPFDIPVIRPNNLTMFVDFFFEQAKPIAKRMKDFAPGVVETFNVDNSYLSINSTTEGWSGGSFTTNPCPIAYEMFPEIFEQIHEYMPFIDNKDFKWSMWSSRTNVPLHRDLTSFIDAPTAIRIKLFDSNPFETLSLGLAVPKDTYISKQSDITLVPLSIPINTNTFAWNNLRTKHRSVYLNNGKKTYKKVLFIVRQIPETPKQIQQYIDLLERSISKYKENVRIDEKFQIKDFIG